MTQYSPEGFLIEQVVISNDELVRTTTFVHDAIGQFTRASVDEDGDRLEDRFSIHEHDNQNGLGPRPAL